MRDTICTAAVRLRGRDCPATRGGATLIRRIARIAGLHRLSRDCAGDWMEESDGDQDIVVSEESEVELESDSDNEQTENAKYIVCRSCRQFPNLTWRGAGSARQRAGRHVCAVH